jgi:hypothetical protein
MITLRHTTLGGTPLDEWPARRRNRYLTAHNIHIRQTPMLPVVFEPTIPASERAQTHALDRAATGIGILLKLVKWSYISVAQWRTQEFCWGGSTNSVDRRQRERGPSQGFRSICKWVKPVVLLGCYGCFLHGTGNSAQLFQIFGISEGLQRHKPRLGTPMPWHKINSEFYD